jgi:PAS domain S-box-containing protein
MYNISPRALPLFLISRVWKIILVVGVLFSIAAGWSIRMMFKRNQEADELVRFEKVVENISNGLDRFQDGLQSTAAVNFISGYQLDPKIFRAYAEKRNFFENFKGALGFGLIRRVSKSQKTSYLQKQKARNPLFKEHSISDSSASQINDSFFIEMIEPYEANRQALGLDIASEKYRQEAAIRSMKSGRSTLTKKIALVQASKGGAGFLYLMPIYSSMGVPREESQRVQNLLGWSYTPILASDLVESAISLVSTPPKIRIYQQQDNQKENLIFDNIKTTSFLDAPIHWTKTIIVGEQTWIVQGASNIHSFWTSYNLVGFLTFIVTSLSTFILVNHSRRVKWEIELRNKALVEARNEVSQSKVALSEQETFLQTVINSVPALIGYWNQNLINVFSNSSYLEYFGNSRTTIKGSHIRDVLGEQIYQANLPFIDKVFKCETQVFEREIPIHLGKFRFLLVNYIPDLRNNEVVGFFVVAMDITKVKELENERREYQAHLAASSKMSSLGEMAGGIAHEINNPLTIIHGSVIQLKKKIKKGLTAGEDISDWEIQLAKIEATVERIAKIVQGLRTFSRNADGDPMEEMEISQIVKETLELCAERFRNNAVDLQVKCSVQTQLECRPTQISQIIMNLLNNGYDAAVQLKEKWVHLDVSEVDGSVIVSVTDSGPGIRKDVAEKMMQPFYTTKEVGKGTGLGLSISKRIAEEHHGLLTYDSVSPHTCFVLTLPIKQPLINSSSPKKAA